ncbi:alpha-amylase family glycosyl hydrolase [Streptomyces sp. NPDC057743]|uniref:glycoside hydrolase family 13 protein n=1 Tax=Streptomyces sp. NPDC057743 TaxID=3346236 RepID=UPI00369C4935
MSPERGPAGGRETAPAHGPDEEWWRTAVVYQVYPRSFADGDGDGVGDLAGLCRRLDHLVRLGVDALWITPWYPSPMADGGYDVVDPRGVDPVFGTLREAEELIAEARRRGLRTILDVVPNHVSRDHPWFRAALAAGPGGPERALFHFRPGRGQGGELPPNNWGSEFGGPAWTRVVEPDGTPGEWYLHLFAPEQPDLNWADARVRAEYASVLRFWFDRGVAGLRIDSATLLTKDPRLPDRTADGPHPYADREDLHPLYRSWRRIADSYPERRLLVGEMWLRDPARLARYLRPDELHTAFNFGFLQSPWDADRLRACIDATLAGHAAVGAPPTWVLANHDVTRTATRYGRADTSFDFARKAPNDPGDRALGTRRARAACLLTLALPGSVYLYQGEELGLPEVTDLPSEHRRDPMHLRSGGTDPGRDGCRIPMPWSGAAPPYGFGPDGSRPWLPQPDTWAPLTVAAQRADPASMLSLYRAALRLRRTALTTAGDTPSRLSWLPAPDGVLAFRWADSLSCWVNLTARRLPLPAGRRVLLASGPLPDGYLPPDTAAWLREEEPTTG